MKSYWGIDHGEEVSKRITLPGTTAFKAAGPALKKTGSQAKGFAQRTGSQATGQMRSTFGNRRMGPVTARQQGNRNTARNIGAGAAGGTALGAAGVGISNRNRGY